MIKILFLVSTFRRSGPTNQLFYILKNLNYECFDVHILTLSPEPVEDSLKFMFEELNVQLYSLGLSRLEGLFFAKKKFNKFLSRLQPKVIHSQGVRPDILNAVSRSTKILSISTSRNYPFLDYPSKYGKILGMLIAYRHISVFRTLRVVACSYNIASKLAEHSIDSLVVQNGVDEFRYSPVSGRDKQALRARLGLPISKKIFIAVGSLIPRKDMKTVLTAFKMMNQNRRSLLIILGNGVQMSELKSISGESCLLLGSIENVDAYLKSADFYISASYAEGLPNTVLEAMASGLPCILSDIPAHRELLGSEDIFFKCGNVKELSNKMKCFVEDSSIDKGNHVRKIVEEQFSSKEMSKKYQAIYVSDG